MAQKGGQNAHDLVYNILTSVLNNDLAVSYSFFGHKGKQKFSNLKLTSAIVSKFSFVLIVR